MNQISALGEIRLFATDYITTGWLPCDGRPLSIASNVPLFSMLGFSYGGNGQDTFNLPSLAPLVSAGGGQLLYAISMSGAFQSSGRSVDGIVSMIQPFAQVSPNWPSNWVPCDGRTLSVTTYPALADVLGATFGGDGVNTVGVPNIPPLQANNGTTMPYLLCATGFYPRNRGTYLDYAGAAFLFGATLPLNLPQDRSVCDGSRLDIVGNNLELFSLLGARYGGDGTTFFHIPNLTPPVAGTRYLLNTLGVYPARA